MEVECEIMEVECEIIMEVECEIMEVECEIIMEAQEERWRGSVKGECCHALVVLQCTYIPVSVV